MRGAGTGGLTYSPAGAPSRAELTGLSDGPPSRGCRSFGSELDWNRARVPAPEGIALCRPVGPRNLNAIPTPFLCLPLSLPHLSPSAFFFSPLFILPPSKDTKVAAEERFGGSGSFSLWRATVWRGFLGSCFLTPQPSAPPPQPPCTFPRRKSP